MIETIYEAKEVAKRWLGCNKHIKDISYCARHPECIGCKCEWSEKELAQALKIFTEKIDSQPTTDVIPVEHVAGLLVYAYEGHIPCDKEGYECTLPCCDGGYDCWLNALREGWLNDYTR